MSEVSVQENNQVAVSKNELTQSARFTNAVMKQFSNNSGEVKLTSFQKKLIQNYFIKIDAILETSEIKRMAKSEQYREPLAYDWKNINMQKLATEVVALSSVQLDPLQPNHINPIPYKNNTTDKYDITFIIGYRGFELKAKKYGFEAPDDVVIELVYSNDVFKPIKKSVNNRVESYEFEIIDAFDRGEIKGGFYYHSFYDHPEKNKLRILTMSDVMKRKPKYASAEFWGGEKDKWEGGKKVGKETIDGWFDEMVYKTIFRAAYNDITIDSEKIDEHFVRSFQNEAYDEYKQIEPQGESKVTIEIKENANKKQLTFEQDIEPVSQDDVKEEPKQPEVVQPKLDGPGF